ncbi:anti-repressor SinI family protein [Salimicrobium halophilum]|uniref:Anti-repressor SinI n=1 Tax=Salimicrobium halophilum TaxID=86666 RepID=A0A1G8SDG1_9BACI|nr:anti-repressor SinI family protein [Salimicrobium halophilum]SDJ27211.1 Anti-repressor SinI [Salimicrobium halophilum]
METLDQEWVELLQEAKDLGMSIEEVKQFLEGDRSKSKR